MGPIPAGTPVGLLNLNPLSEDPAQKEAHDKQLLQLVIDLNNDLKSLGKYPTDAQAARSS